MIPIKNYPMLARSLKFLLSHSTNEMVEDIMSSPWPMVRWSNLFGTLLYHSSNSATEREDDLARMRMAKAIPENYYIWGSYEVVDYLYSMPFPEQSIFPDWCNTPFTMRILRYRAKGRSGRYVKDFNPLSNASCAGNRWLRSVLGRLRRAAGCSCH